MSADKYPSIFSRQMKAIVYILLQKTLSILHTFSECPFTLSIDLDILKWFNNLSNLNFKPQNEEIIPFSYIILTNSQERRLDILLAMVYTKYYLWTCKTLLMISNSVEFTKGATGIQSVEMNITCQSPHINLPQKRTKGFQIYNNHLSLKNKRWQCKNRQKLTIKADVSVSS